MHNELNIVTTEQDRKTMFSELIENTDVAGTVGLLVLRWLRRDIQCLGRDIFTVGNRRTDIPTFPQS